MKRDQPASPAAGSAVPRPAGPAGAGGRAGARSTGVVTAAAVGVGAVNRGPSCCPFQMEAVEREQRFPVERELLARFLHVSSLEFEAADAASLQGCLPVRNTSPGWSLPRAASRAPRAATRVPRARVFATRVNARAPRATAFATRVNARGSRATVFATRVDDRAARAGAATRPGPSVRCL